MTFHTIATDPALWAQYTEEPFTGTLDERLALLDVLFHYEEDV